MVQSRIVGGYGEPLPQDTLTFLVPLLSPVEIRQIYIRRCKRGIDPQCRTVDLLGFQGLAELCLQHTQVEVRLWPVGIQPPPRPSPEPQAGGPSPTLNP
jgi:hypothetical protein